MLEVSTSPVVGGVIVVVLIGVGRKFYLDGKQREHDERVRLEEAKSDEEQRRNLEEQLQVTAREKARLEGLLRTATSEAEKARIRGLQAEYESRERVLEEQYRRLDSTNSDGFQDL